MQTKSELQTVLENLCAELDGKVSEFDGEVLFTSKAITPTFSPLSYGLLAWELQVSTVSKKQSACIVHSMSAATAVA